MLSDHPAIAHALHVTAVGYVRVGPVVLAALLGWAWWAARRRPAAAMAAALWAPIGVVAAIVVNEPIEQMPTLHWTAFHGLVVRSSDLPAPSDHAAMAAATAAALLLSARKVGVAACGAWLTMALALIVGGAEPADLAGGTIVGVTVTLIGYVLAESPLRIAVTRMRRTRLRSFTGAGESS